MVDLHGRMITIMRRFDRQTVFLAAIALVTVVAVIYLVAPLGRGPSGEAQVPAGKSWRSSPIDGRRALEHIQALCAIGPRPSGSAGMKKQQELLIEHFQKLGAKVSRQSFEIRHPQDGTPVRLDNLIVECHPDRMDRVLFCAHYDTRPFPDRDPRRPKGRFVGANDGASGVAVLMELARHVVPISSRYGVDLVMLDGEEFIFEERRDPYFLGSEHFAREYKSKPPPHRYHWGVLLDMVGDSQLQLFQEKNSVNWPDTRPLVDELWNTARRMGVVEFINRPKHELRDDHLALHDIAGIPTCDVIDFDYPRSGGTSYWHTEADTPDKCSAESLRKVGAVMLEWYRSLDARR